MKSIPQSELEAMKKDLTSPPQNIPVALFDFSPEQLADENLDATVEQVMAALAQAQANCAAQTPPASHL